MLKVILKHYLRFCKSFDPALLCEILSLIPNKELSADSGMFEWFFHWAVMNKMVTYEALKALLDNGVQIQVDRFSYSGKQAGDKIEIASIIQGRIYNDSYGSNVISSDCWRLILLSAPPETFRRVEPASVHLAFSTKEKLAIMAVGKVKNRKFSVQLPRSVLTHISMTYL